MAATNIKLTPAASKEIPLFNIPGLGYMEPGEIRTGIAASLRDNTFLTAEEKDAVLKWSHHLRFGPSEQPAYGPVSQPLPEPFPGNLYFSLYSPGLGCHVATLTGVSVTLNQQIPLTKVERFLTEIPRWVFDTVLKAVGRHNISHVYMSDNYNGVHGSARAEHLTAKGRKATPPTIWAPKGTPAFEGWDSGLVAVTNDFLEYLVDNCAKDPKTFGHVTVTPFTANIKYRGITDCANRSAVWIPPYVNEVKIADNAGTFNTLSQSHQRVVDEIKAQKASKVWK